MKKFNQAMPFFSNYLESLYEELEKNLFDGSNPFTERIVIAPSESMHSWIKMRLADSIGIASGVTTCFLNQGILKLVDHLFKRPVKSFLPNRVELLLRLEDEIQKALLSDDSIWEPLKKYLNGKEQRIIPLARYLAQLFNKYGIYGEDECANWENEPKGWQEALWKHIFADWNYPYRFLTELVKKESFSNDISVHLFSFSHLSPLHFNFFNKVGQLAPLYYYHLSPCQEFWSDIQSDREIHNFKRELKRKGHSEKVGNDFEGYLTDRSPLLANLGKVGRKQAFLFEESDLEPIECYISLRGNTQLERVQQGILQMEQSEQILDDDSIQLHIAPTPYREIEILYNNLLSLLDQDDLLPYDILVMAPDIIVYEPYIRAFFGEKIGYQIADTPVEMRNQQINGVIKLLELDKRRWSGPALMDLFNHSLFKSKIGWHEEDLSQIREWIQKTGIRWGMNSAHRNQLLKQSCCQGSLDDSGATWAQGIEYLLEELAISFENARIDFTHAELLGELALVLKELQSDLIPISDGSKRVMKDWASYLKNLNETYFSDLEEDRKVFYEQLDHLVKASSFLSNNTYNFSDFFSILREMICNESVAGHSNAVQTVRFCSMIPMRAIPAKVICLLGMDHDAFPRRERTHMLDLLKKKMSSPARVEFDRYLFLEAILSARKKLIMSYQGCDPLDQTEKPPSSVISELFPYISKNQIIRHPFHSYDPSYFNQSNRGLKNYSERNFQMAMAMGLKKRVDSFFIHLPSELEIPSGELIIDIADLQRAARSPLRHYFHHTLGINFFNELVMKEEEDFTLTPLQMSKMRRRSLNAPIHSVIQNAKREEGFPLGIFGKLATHQIEKELPESYESASFILLEHEKRSRQVESNLWHLPPIRITYSHSTKFVIVGRIEGITEKGLLTLEKGEIQGAIKSWPLYLAYNMLERPFGGEELVFYRDKKFKSPFFPSAESQLRAFLEYYIESKQIPFPFLPDWISQLLKGDAEKLENAIQKSLEEGFDQAVQWGLSGKRISGRYLIEHWQEKAIDLYGAMSNAWF